MCGTKRQISLLVRRRRSSDFVGVLLSAALSGWAGLTIAASFACISNFDGGTVVSQR